MFCEANYYLPSNYTPTQLFVPTENCTWLRGEPTATAYIIYALVIPVLSTFGLCANIMNALVFMRPKMSPSAFSYLAALAWFDCISCLLITLTALSRSIFFDSLFWMTYDFQWQIPLFGISTGAANLLLASLSLDRWLYLRHGIGNGAGGGSGAQPRFCRRKVARVVIVGIVIVALVLNMPYFFVFVVNSNGTFGIRNFYLSTFYKVYNWCSFILLTLLPAVLLIIGHIAIIIAFRRWTNQSRICRKYGACNTKTTQKRYQHQMKLTITIIILIVLYITGEMPAALTSRKSSLNLLFGGDITRVNFEKMANVEMICLSMNALQLSMNILVYALINPSFMPELFICLHGTSDFFCNILCLRPLMKYVLPQKQQQNTEQTKGQNTVEMVSVHEQNDDNTARIESVVAVEVNTHNKGHRKDSSASTNSNWDTEMEDVPVDSSEERKKNSKPKFSRVWSTGVTWSSTSSTICVKAFDNPAWQVSDEMMSNVHDLHGKNVKECDGESASATKQMATKQYSAGY